MNIYIVFIPYAEKNKKYWRILKMVLLVENEMYKVTVKRLLNTLATRIGENSNKSNKKLFCNLLNVHLSEILLFKIYLISK